MPSDADRWVRDMEWGEFEAQLSRSARGGKSRAVSDQALRDHFGPEKLERLQRLADRVRSSSSEARAASGQYHLYPRYHGFRIDCDWR